jgi:hypothetical protein
VAISIANLLGFVWIHHPNLYGMDTCLAQRESLRIKKKGRRKKKKLKNT